MGSTPIMSTILSEKRLRQRLVKQDMGFRPLRPDHGFIPWQLPSCPPRLASRFILFLINLKKLNYLQKKILSSKIKNQLRH